MVTKGYGITVDDIDNGCPNDFKPYDLAHNEELKEKDTLLYEMGLYNLSALSTVIANVFGKREQYMKEPLLAKVENDKKAETAEGREEVAALEMSLWMKRCEAYGLEQSPR